MPGVKSLARVVVVWTAMALAQGAGARADSISNADGWVWTEWVPGQGATVLSSANGPSPFGQWWVGPNGTPSSDAWTPSPAQAQGAAVQTTAATSSATFVPPPAVWSTPTGSVPTGSLPAQSTVTNFSPSNWQSPPASSATSTAASTWVAPAQTPRADAFINFGSGPFPAASNLATGNPQPWYNSPTVTQLFGGVPTAQQQSDFTNTVLQRVDQTYLKSGIPVQLTIDPSVPAAHTLSVVSNTSSNTMSNAIGMTYLGGNGLNFIDKIGGAAQSVDQLEWIVAHNVAHELMLAFGVGENYDKSGNYIDSPVANLGMMLDPNATFSQAAAQALLASNLQANSTGSGSIGAQSINASTVPEPASVAAWMFTIVAIQLPRFRRRKTD